MGFMEDDLDAGMRITNNIMAKRHCSYDMARKAVRAGDYCGPCEGSGLATFNTCVVCDGTGEAMAQPIAQPAPTPDITAWIPMRDPKTLALIGKLGEEATELAKACFRASIQGLDGIDPDNGHTNAENIAREYMDIKAVMDTMDDRSVMPYPSDMPGLKSRHGDKVKGFHYWMALIDAHYGPYYPTSTKPAGFPE